MTLHVMCPNCRARLEVTSLPPGQKARCGSCGSFFLVPGPAPLEPPVAPAPRRPDAPPQPSGEAYIVCGACMGRFPTAALPPGGKIRCGRCGNIITVPAPASATSVVLESIGRPGASPPGVPVTARPAAPPPPSRPRVDTSRLSRLSKYGQKGKSGGSKRGRK